MSKRNYEKEYKDYHGRPEQIARRSNRNKARRKTKAPKGVEVEHKDGNPMNNDRDNLSFTSSRFQRRQGGRKTSGNRERRR